MRVSWRLHGRNRCLVALQNKCSCNFRMAFDGTGLKNAHTQDLGDTLPQGRVLSSWRQPQRSLPLAGSYSDQHGTRRQPIGKTVNRRATGTGGDDARWPVAELPGIFVRHGFPILDGESGVMVRYGPTHMNAGIWLIRNCHLHG